MSPLPVTVARDLFFAELDAIEQVELLARFGEGPPGIGIDPLVEVERDLRAGIAVAVPRSAQLRRQDPRVVDDENVAGLEQVDQVGDMPVGQRAVMGHDQHARAVARLGWMERDPVGWQLEIEGVDVHGGVLAGVAPCPNARAPFKVPRSSRPTPAPAPGIRSVPPET